MKKLVIVLGAIGLTAVLVTAGFALGVGWNQGRWGYDTMGYGPGAYGSGYGMMGSGTTLAPARSAGVGYGSGYDVTGPGMIDYGPGMYGSGYSQGYGMMGSGMMGYGPGVYGPGYGSGYGMMGPMMGSWNGPYSAPDQGNTTSLDEATAAFQAYVDRLGYTGLQVTEVMEFQYNYYAIVAEKDTGIGAMELLLGKSTGVVRPEPGPNMMWNANYSPMGRYGGMMGSYASGEMTVTHQDAEAIGQRWLDANMPGTTAGEADPFYGYYTLHFLKDGQVVGMLSVQASTGQVWYHSWHGDFVAMTEGHS
jgi:hypothetical protein